MGTRREASPSGLVAGIAGLGFVALTLLALTGSYLPGEAAWLRNITAWRVPWLDALAPLVSALGSINVILPVWCGALLIAVWQRRPRVFASLLPIPLGYPVYVLIKSWVARPGTNPQVYPWIHDLSIGYFFEGLVRRQVASLPPQGVSVPVVSNPITSQAVSQVLESGYISGHAFLGALLYGTLALSVWRVAKPGAGRRAAALILAALQAGVGLARVYMAVHFPSDVLGAWLLAAVALVAVDRSTGKWVPVCAQAWRRALARPERQG